MYSEKQKRTGNCTQLKVYHKGEDNEKERERTG